MQPLALEIICLIDRWKWETYFSIFRKPRSRKTSRKHEVSDTDIGFITPTTPTILTATLLLCCGDNNVIVLVSRHQMVLLKVLIIINCWSFHFNSLIWIIFRWKRIPLAIIFIVSTSWDVFICILSTFKTFSVVANVRRRSWIVENQDYIKLSTQVPRKI